MKSLRNIRRIEEIPERGTALPCALALGAFDGLHRGHMAVLESARNTSLPGGAGVVTFEASPSGGALLLMSEEKEALLAEMGMQVLYSFEFSGIREIPAEEFAEKVLFEKCGAMELCCGEDFRFGKGAKGDIRLLEELCRKRGAKLTVTPSQQAEGGKISSTRIRQAIEQGNLPLANRLLGRPFGYAGEVIHGNHIGTKLGTPTANLALPENFVLPPFGVYASRVKVEGTRYYGVTNIGKKPTVGSDKVLSETWIPDWSGDLYGKKLRLSLLQFIRPERKFDSLEELRAEILKNAAQAEKIVRQVSFSEP